MAFLTWIARAARGLGSTVRNYFEQQDPRFSVALPPALLVAIALYVRSPLSNYIFDEQEALLANPYVNSNELSFFSAFQRDFWGLPPSAALARIDPFRT